MQLSTKRKKRLLGFLGISTIFLVLVYWCATSKSPFIISSGSVATYTKDELADLYWKHKDELDKVAEIVFASDALRQIIIDENDDDCGVYTEYDKRYFTESDWNEIVDLFKKIRPYLIMRSLRQGDTVYFNFRHQKTSDMEISTSLYYFKSPATMEVYKGYSWVGDLEQLDGYWYIGEYIREL